MGHVVKGSPEIEESRTGRVGESQKYKTSLCALLIRHLIAAVRMVVVVCCKTYPKTYIWVFAAHAESYINQGSGC